MRQFCLSNIRTKICVLFVSGIYASASFFIPAKRVVSSTYLVTMITSTQVALYRRTYLIILAGQILNWIVANNTSCLTPL